MATSIPTEMQAVQVVDHNAPYSLNTVPVPSQLDPHDLLVKVAVASYCHTDSMVRSGLFGGSLPQTASHEGAGIVVKTGTAVSDFKLGDRVMCGLPFHPCETCFDCTDGPDNQRQYCTKARHIGVHINGAMAEYVRVDSRSSTPVPDNVSLLDAAPLACAGRTVWRAIEQAGLQPGQWLGLVGAGGGLGHLGIQFAKLKGLKVIAVDARDDGLSLSKDYGADAVVDAREGKETVIKRVQKMTGGKNPGADATITLADAESAASLACGMTRMHGTMVQIAQPAEVKIPFHELIFRDIKIKGSVICAPTESRAFMDFLSSNTVDVKKRVFYGLDKIHDLVSEVQNGKLIGKAIIVIDPEQVEM